MTKSKENEILEWLENYRRRNFKGKGPEESGKYRLFGKVIRYIKDAGNVGTSDTGTKLG